MAVRGTRPKPTALRLVQGNAGRRPIPQGEPQPGGRPKPLTKLTGRPLVHWRNLIVPAFWLTGSDGPLAFVLVHLLAEFEANPTGMQASKVSQIRAACSSLGFDPSSRARLGTTPPVRDAADRYFG